MLFIHAGIHDNSLVIIKENNNLFLGKILESVRFNKKNGKKISSKVIIYFDEDTNIENFRDDYKKFKVICSDKKSLYYNYFSYKNKQNLQISKIDEKSINIHNKFIFEYLCFKLFGKKNTLYIPGYIEDTQYADYYVFQDNIEDIGNVNKEDILGIRDDNNGFYLTISVPFKYIDYQLRSVFIPYDDYKNIIVEFLNSLDKREYYNISELVLNSKINFKNISDNIKLIKDGNESYFENLSDSNIINYNNITKTSIFKDAI